MMNQTPRSRVSTRERAMLIGFAFFAEAILGYFLLIDPDVTKLQHLEHERGQANTAIEALEGAEKKPPEPAAGASVPPPLVPQAGETFDLALQRYLDAQIQESGTTPISIGLPTPGPQESPSPYRHAHVVARGPYKAVSDLVNRMGHPRYRIGLETLSVKPDGEDPSRLRADLDLFVELPPAGAVAATPTPRPSATLRPSED